LNAPTNIELKRLNRAVDSQLYKIRSGDFDVKLNEQSNFTLINSLMSDSTKQAIEGKTIWLSFVCLNDLNKKGKSLSHFMHRNADPNIQFVTVFFGRDSLNWQHQIERLKLPGIHLQSKGKTNALMREFKIKGMPHFVLLSPQKKILGMNVSIENKYVVPDYILYRAKEGICASNAILELNDQVITDDDKKWLQKQMKQHRKQTGN
jgi:hypothetical protein